eukprot:902664-Ditylum_brightwellii.AAC.1
MPKLLSQDIIAHTAEKLSNALQKPQPATPFHNIGSEQLMALEQLLEIFNCMAKTSNDNTYKPYTIPQMDIPERIKTVNTTPPPRVPTKLPNIIPPDDPTTPSLRVQPCRSPRQHQGPHMIPQCNMAHHQYLSAIPPYFVNA